MSGKSIFQYYLETLTKKYPYRVMDKDPYVLYSITQSCHKDYEVFRKLHQPAASPAAPHLKQALLGAAELYIFDGFQFGNHTIGEDKKTFYITYNGRSETIIIWKDGNR
jgi:hypothetical protein